MMLILVAANARLIVENLLKCAALFTRHVCVVCGGLVRGLAWLTTARKRCPASATLRIGLHSMSIAARLTLQLCFLICLGTAS